MESKSSRLIRQSLFYGNLSYHQDKGEVKPWTTDDCERAIDIKKIEELVCSIAKSKGPAFSVKTDRHSGREYLGETHIGTSVLLALKIKAEDIKNHFPIHKLNPCVDLYFKQMSERGIPDIAWQAGLVIGEKLRQLVDVLNGFVESVRAEARSAKFKTAMNNYLRSSKENYASLNAYTNAWFHQCARILVVRLDCAYLKEHGWLAGKANSVSYEETRQHRKDFVSKMRSHPELFEHMLGYVIKMEFGSVKGWHYHVMILLDGSKVREDVTMARLIGEYWVGITGGKGLYYNCNAHKNQYWICGIGMINHDDAVAREGLKLAAAYLTKTDSMIKLVAPGKDRTFFKGEMPKPKPVKRGRPRKTSKQDKCLPSSQNLNQTHILQRDQEDAPQPETPVADKRISFSSFIDPPPASTTC